MVLATLERVSTGTSVGTSVGISVGTIVVAVGGTGVAVDCLARTVAGGLLVGNKVGIRCVGVAVTTGGVMGPGVAVSTIGRIALGVAVTT